MIRFIIPIVAAVLLALPGCGGSTPTFERTTTVTEQQALDAAKAALRDRGEVFADTAAMMAVPMGNGWKVTVSDSASGEERLIILDGDGKVAQYDG